MDRGIIYMLCISHIHLPFQNLLKMYTYVGKKIGHLTQIVLIFLLFFLARDKERKYGSL